MSWGKRIIRQLNNQIGFRFTNESEIAVFQLYRNVVEYKPEINKAHLDDVLIKAWQNLLWPCHEYIVKYDKPCLLEPGWGYAINSSLKIIRESNWYNFVHYPQTAKPYAHKCILNRKKAKRLKTALWLPSAANYWHFYFDHLAAIARFDEHIKDPDVPILINKKLGDSLFFNQILSFSPSLRKRKWIFWSEKDYFVSETTYFMQTLEGDMSDFQKVMPYISNILYNMPDIGREKVFISRSGKWGRTVDNAEEIEKIATDYGFVVINFDGLTVRQQIESIRYAKFCIGVHGASLANLLFVNSYEKLALLELFSPDFINPVYFKLVSDRGGKYYGMTGMPMGNHGNFYINPDLFSIRLKQLLSEN